MILRLFSSFHLRLFGIFFLFWMSSCGPTLQEIKQSQKLYTLGVNQATKGQLREALVVLSKAVSLNSGDYWIYEAIGGVYMKLQHPHRALPFYQKAVELKPKSPRGLNNLGTVYMALKRWKPAIVIFQKALDNILYQTPCFAQLNLGMAYHEIGKHHLSLQWLQKGIQECPKLCQGYRMLGMTTFSQKNYSLATFAFKELTTRCKQFPPGHYWYAFSLYKQGKKAKALQAIEKCLAFNASKAGFQLQTTCTELLEKIQKLSDSKP